MYPTPALAFFLNDGKIIAYDLTQHCFFEVDAESFEQLKSLSCRTLPLEHKSWKKFNDLGIYDLFMDLPWQGDPLSHVAHQSSRILCINTEILSKQEYVNQYSQVSAQAPNVPVKDLPYDGEVIALPLPKIDCFDAISLGECFRDRKTSRNFIDQPINLDQISNILYHCFGPIHGQKRDELTQSNLNDVGFRRSSPSSTGLASCDAILWSNNVTDLDKGLYSYDEQNHQLIRHNQDLSEQELIYSMLDQFWIDNLAAGIFIVNDLRRTWAKDIKCRGYLASHQEAGHLSQNILLSATALGLKTWLSGTFRDDFLQYQLGLAHYRFVSLFVGLGHGNNQAVSQEYLNILNNIES